MSKLVTLRVEKMAVAVEKQSFKIEKMAQILTRVHQAVAHKVEMQEKTT
jgi:hypothetical protein